jgi:hypothetical protein
VHKKVLTAETQSTQSLISIFSETLRLIGGMTGYILLI